MSILQKLREPLTRYPDWKACARSAARCERVCRDAGQAHTADMPLQRAAFDCADICAATSFVLDRPGAPDLRVIRMLVETVAQTTRRCAEVWEAAREHPDQNCSATCRETETVADRLFASLAPGDLDLGTVEKQ